MRNSVDAFLEKVQSYLEDGFSKRVEELNGKGADLADIAIWASGFDGVASGLEAYPGCLLLVGERTIKDPYSSIFKLSIAIALAGDDPKLLQEQGHLWEDILEDSIRADYHLGEAALDIDLGFKILSDCVSGQYVITTEIMCEVDLGGYVYEGEE